MTDFRIINTAGKHVGPAGVPYIHDAAQPFAVLFNSNRGEICCARYPTLDAANAGVTQFRLSRARHAERHGLVREPRTAAGSLD